MTETISDPAAEQIVLGAMLLDAAVIDPVTEILTSGDFYDARHGKVFATITASWANESPTDPAAVAAALAATGDLGRIGAPYLHELVASVPTTANATWYGRVVAEHATRRRIIVAAARIRTLAADPGQDIAELENLAEREVLAAVGTRRTGSLFGLDELMDATLPGILSDQGPERGLTTGIGALDDQLGGLKPGQLTIVAGRPGAGKSVACVDFARANIRRQIPVAFFSLEMHRAELVGRILSATAGANLFRVLNGGLRYDERQRIQAASEHLRGSPLWIQTGDTDVATVRSVARKLRSRGKLELLVVDYLQLMTGTRRESRVLEVGEISRGLKKLAGELEIPVVAAAQLNRSAEQRVDRRPQLSDLRESGSLEQDCDIAILLHRPDQTDHNSPRKGEVDLIVAKNRNGPLDTVTALAQLEYSRFVDGDIP